MNFFLQKQLIKLSFTYWPLSICKIFKKLLGSMQSNECMPFSDPKWSICHEKKFFSTNHYYYFNYLLDLFMCKIQKNSYSRSRVMRMRNFRAQNGPFPQMNFFSSENLLMSLVSFIHWPRAIFSYNLRSRFFPSMQFPQNVNEP